MFRAVPQVQGMLSLGRFLTSRPVLSGGGLIPAVPLALTLPSSLLPTYSPLKVGMGIKLDGTQQVLEKLRQILAEIIMDTNLVDHYNL